MNSRSVRNNDDISWISAKATQEQTGKQMNHLGM